MDKPTPAEWLELLIERAPALREAGVHQFEIGDVKVALHPHYVAQEEALDEDDVPTREQKDPLDDPDLYPGGRLPRRRGANA